MQVHAPVEGGEVREEGAAAIGPTQDAGAPEPVQAAVEAILLSLDKPVGAMRLAEALGLDKEETGAPAKRIDDAVRALNESYERTGRSFRIERVAGGYRVMTLPVYAEAVAAFHAARAPTRLSRAAIETLAIVAYRQPITRAELEAIRGVACGEVLKTLLERRLVDIVGRAEELGRPMLYGTTKRFLELFGLASLKDLPTVGDLTGRVVESEAMGARAEGAPVAPDVGDATAGDSREHES